MKMTLGRQRRAKQVKAIMHKVLSEGA